MPIVSGSYISCRMLINKMSFFKLNMKGLNNTHVYFRYHSFLHKNTCTMRIRMLINLNRTNLNLPGMYIGILARNSKMKRGNGAKIPQVEKSGPIACSHVLQMVHLYVYSAVNISCIV